MNKEDQNLGVKTSDTKRDKRTKNTYYISTRLNKERAKKIFDYFYNSEFSSKDFLDRKLKKLMFAL